jgi:hypothetical protein
VGRSRYHVIALPTRVSVPGMPGFLCMNGDVCLHRRENKKQEFQHMLNNRELVFVPPST